MINFETTESNMHFDGVLDLDPKEIERHLEELTIVDVRQPEEFKGELGHIPGARLIVLDTLPVRLIDIPKDKPIVFVCRSGARSARAAVFVSEQGFKNVYNMKGGMLLWNDLHLKTEA